MLAICLHHVYLSANIHLPLPPCPFKPERRLHLSSSARHHLHHVYSGTNTRFPPPSPQIEPKCSSPTSVVSIGAQTPPPPPCPFKLKHSPSASTMSIQAQILISHLHQLERLPSASTMSIRAQTLVSHLHRVYSSLNTHHPSQPLPFERNRSFPVFLLPSYLFLHFLDRF